MTESTSPGRVVVEASGAPYPVVVGPGVVTGLTDELNGSFPGRRVALISDSRVAPLHAERIAASCRDADIDVTLLTFEAGEASKTRQTWSILTDQMLEAGLGRDSCVVAVGGGVTTDLAGFVAATYLRGVPTILVPTSYLAMVDASVGGKTGVDVRAGKNLVGAFHAPALVLADTELLLTLPPSERAQGLVEAYKHGAILDEGHFLRLSEALSALLSADPDAAAQAILDSVALKATVVARDEFEGGYRQILNFGHTLGHVIEAASEYAIGHGTAVALGMIGEAVLGERLGVTSPGTSETLESALRPLIGTSMPAIEVEDALQYLSVDKKARSGDARFVLLERVGRVSPGESWTHVVPRVQVAEVLSEVMGQEPVVRL